MKVETGKAMLWVECLFLCLIFLLCFDFDLCKLCIILLLFQCLLCIIILLLFQCLLCIIILLLFQCLLCIIFVTISMFISVKTLMSIMAIETGVKHLCT